MVNKQATCHNCGHKNPKVFYNVSNVPVHSVLLMPTREAALNCPRGDIALGFCQSCGFISNLKFDPTQHNYSEKYEETQGFSETFNSFHQDLATRLIKQHNLYNKKIIEIGCGKGEFLTQLCQMGNNQGTGFDPAYVEGRNHAITSGKVEFVKDFYTTRYTNYQADFICCKMTLEHIQQTADFVTQVRQSIKNPSDTIVFFQVPDVTRIFQETAFWDIYYEHCSYFTPHSLAYLFQSCGFEILDLRCAYDAQYLMIEARATSNKNTLDTQQKDSQALMRHVNAFGKHAQLKINAWQHMLKDATQKGRKTVIWGGGSKGVAFLTTLGIHREIEYVVDINPHKYGTYMAGTGQEIVSPEFLKTYQPDTVVVMNPIYRDEIKKDLQSMGLTPELIMAA